MKPIFDATSYLNKPTPPEWFHRLQMYYDNGDPLTKAQEAVDNDRLLCLDIERYETDIRKASGKVVEQGMDALGAVADYVREHCPGLQFGFYGEMPPRDYWAAVTTDDVKRKAWKKAASRFKYGYEDGRQGASPVGPADKVSVIFPSLYTFYEDMAGWEKYAIENIKMARMYQKPVYPFIWMDYHQSNAALGLQYVGDEFWRLQIETCLEHADGVVVWGGWDLRAHQRKEWDDNAAWWRVLRDVVDPASYQTGRR